MPSANKSFRFIVICNGLVLVAFLAYTLYAGDIATSGPVLFGSPWGQMTLIDLYSGFVLFALFIYSQERFKAKAVAWIVALMLLGNLIACLYLLLWLKKFNAGSCLTSAGGNKNDYNDTNDRS